MYYLFSAEGTIVCGKYDNGIWSQASCEIHRLTGDLTQCSCDEQGMYALLLSRKTAQVLTFQTRHTHIILIPYYNCVHIYIEHKKKF